MYITHHTGTQTSLSLYAHTHFLSICLTQWESERDVHDKSVSVDGHARQISVFGETFRTNRDTKKDLSY